MWLDGNKKPETRETEPRRGCLPVEGVKQPHLRLPWMTETGPMAKAEHWRPTERRQPELWDFEDTRYQLDTLGFKLILVYKEIWHGCFG